MQRVISDTRLPVKVWATELEAEAEQQVRQVAELPFIFKHVAVMPDAHAGKGSTVGTVLATKGAIIPAAVGVDIGCGMVAAKLSLRASDLPDNLLAIRTAIEAAVPHGRTDNGGASDRGAWGDVPDFINETFGVEGATQALRDGLHAIVQKHPKLERAAKRSRHHLGTLGTGNHFIEVCLDTEQTVWVMLHSGSRGIGNAIGTYFIERAQEHMRRWFIRLPDQDLSYLPESTQDFDDYTEAVHWAQEFARTNRDIMLQATIRALAETLERNDVFVVDEAVNCHHNYVARENHFGSNVWVTRKGAVRARAGDLGIIPGSMGQRSFIVRGLGNPESFHSCSHGAGRRMSRTKARAMFTEADLVAQTSGVECRKDAEVIDEIPGAYKDIDQVMANQADLVEVVATLKQVLCVKG
jgi:tRNA-splicing ligase RtcB (3'-phosphate/5'-hydroxy nucleic acid ligase)